MCVYAVEKCCVRKLIARDKDIYTKDVPIRDARRHNYSETNQTNCKFKLTK